MAAAALCRQGGRRGAAAHGWLAAAARSLASGAGVTAASATPAPGVAADGPPAFVFDVEGVLAKGNNVLPAARRALAKLYEPGGQRPRFPVAFLTNTGGTTEARKAAQLGEMLGVHVDSSQVVMSHTAFRALAPRYASEPVLVVGRGLTLEAARSYGFKRTVTTVQLMRLMPSAVPFSEDAVRTQAISKAPPAAEYRGIMRYGTPEQPIRAILVFSEPSPWYGDLQLCLDVVLGRGVLGRHSPPEDASPVDVYFAHPDLLWTNEFESPRLGMGAFALCLSTLVEKLSGQPMAIRGVYGKPNPEAYELVEQALVEQAERFDLALPYPPEPPAGRRALPPFSAIYGIGDNPEADIRGANGAGDPWVSVLVRGPLFDASCGNCGCVGNCQAYPAHIVVDDVEAAVEAGLHRSRSARWHSLR